MNKQRAQAEKMIYDVMTALDKTEQNTDYYKNIFKNMSDEQFVKFIKNPLAFKFQTKLFEIEPTMNDINKAAKIMNVPILEKLSLPYYYTNKDGKPVITKDALIIYLNIKKMKQFITKKNSMSVNINERDMKTGLLVNFDKNGKTSDRELESITVLGLDKTLEEFTHPKADSMKAKSVMYSTINVTGTCNLKDLPKDIDDSLSKNYLNAYLIGSQLISNLITDDYYLPYTLTNREEKRVKHQ